MAMLDETTRHYWEQKQTMSEAIKRLAEEVVAHRDVIERLRAEHGDTGEWGQEACEAIGDGEEEGGQAEGGDGGARGEGEGLEAKAQDGGAGEGEGGLV
jgi:hypothetical protein